MKIDIISLFPGMLTGFLSESIIGKACERGLVQINLHDLRRWGLGKWQQVDDRPFGGGAGMLIRPEPMCAAIDAVRQPDSHTIYLSPDGQLLNHALAVELARLPHLILVSGHYEGIDQRIRDSRIDREVSIGDYVLTNGTLPAAVLVDVVVRRLPGVLGEEKSLTQDAFHHNFLGFPQYTRPVEFEGMRVPEVLLSGHHGAIDAWRKARAIDKTRERRPDILSTTDN